MIFLGACSTATDALNHQFKDQLPSTAQKPFRSLSAGKVFTLESSGSEELKQRWRFSGKEIDHYRFDITGDSDYSQKLFNQDGAVVKAVSHDLEINYKPHDCSRVIGTCEFQTIDQHNGTQYFKRYGYFDGEAWQYRLYIIKTEKPILEESGRIQYDHNGFPQFIEKTEAGNPAMTWVQNRES